MEGICVSILSVWTNQRWDTANSWSLCFDVINTIQLIRKTNMACVGVHRYVCFIFFRMWNVSIKYKSCSIDYQPVCETTSWIVIISTFLCLSWRQCFIYSAASVDRFFKFYLIHHPLTFPVHFFSHYYFFVFFTWPPRRTNLKNKNGRSHPARGGGWWLKGV